MNNKFLAFYCFLFVLIGCEKKESLSFSSESFTEESLELCKEVSCPKVTVNYIEAVGELTVSEKINAKIKSFIIASLFLGEGNPQATTIPEAAVDFIKMYRIHNAEFPGMAAEYFAEIDITQLNNSQEIISFEMRQYQYTGGAHGYGSSFFMNIDPKTGEELTTSQIFKDVKAFRDFTEKKFREEYEIASSASINSKGFWFENDTFNLPQEIGFTDDRVIILYNQYDIASYADGPIELEIPLEEISPFLKIK
jgi:hypothetical protein